MTASMKLTSVQDGRAYVTSEDPDFPSRFALKVGDATFLFDAAPADPGLLTAGADILLNGRFESGAAHWSFTDPAPSDTTFGVDILPDARLDEMSTAYISGPERTRPFGLRYNDPVFGDRLPVISGQIYAFGGLFATHRSVGRVEMSFHGAGDDVLSVAAATLTENLGGRRSSDYQRVELLEVAPADAAFARITIRHLRPHNPVAGMSFFVFFSDLSLRVGIDGAGPGTGSLDKSAARSLVEIAEKRSRAALFAASFDGELVTRTGRAVTVVPLADGSDPGEPIVLYDPAVVRAATSAAIAFDGSRLLRITLSGAEICTLFVDGARARDVDLRPGGDLALVAQLPNRLLDGQPHLVELRDAAGLTVLARDYFVTPFHSTPWPLLQEHSTPLLPSQLSPAAADRYRALQAAIDGASRRDGYSADTLRQLSHCHRVVVRGFKQNRSFERLTFPTHEEPRVSIVIPVHNKFEITYFCLCALLLAASQATFEVIVVDDGSSDRTVELAQVVDGITIVRNQTGLGFIGACNRGADSARGRFVVFLNNDTEPTVGWLDELLATFDLFNKVGLAGSKLLYPDGRLQEAGGIVWASGNPWNYGRDQNPNDPRYSYTRQADYLSGAAIMLPTAVWREVGGFSTDYMPAYFEDTDLAFKVRDHGFKVLFAAKSVVYHFEGATGGTDVSSGAKRYQELNRPKFKSRWIGAYRAHGKEGISPDLEKDRGIHGRALFVDYQTPKPDMDAGGYAALEEMRLVQALGYKVTFLPQNLAYLGRYTEDLQRMGVEMLYAPFAQSIEELLETRGHEFDVIYMTRYYVVQYCVEAARRWAPQAKLIMNNADLHFLRELRAALAEGSDQKLAEAVETRDKELATMRQVDLALSYSDVEQAVILSHNLGSTRVMRVPWVERVTAEVKPFAYRRDVAFLGSYNHHPNREAATFFAREVMPIVRDVSPGTKFHLYGSYLSEDVRALRRDDVIIGGYVDDVGEVFDTCRVFVAPLTSGAGIKGKVLKALAHGVPCVLSRVAAEGTGLRSGFDCTIADTPLEWAQAIWTLSSDETVWRTFSERGRDLVRQNYSSDAGLKAMRRAFEAVGLFTP